MGADGYRKLLETSLFRLGTDHVDFYHFWGINRGVYENIILKEGLLEAAAKAKEEGLIRHISFSFHDAPEVVKYIVDTSEERGVKMESMLCQYNLLDRSNEEMIKYVNEKGLGTVAMGPVGGGRLAAPTDLYAKLTAKASIATYELAFKFCLGNPNLNCALSGMQNLDMVQKNVEMYTYYNVYGLKDHAKNMMKNYVQHEGKTFADYKKCGICEKKCPQQLAIREHLEKVCKVLCD